MSLIFVSKVSDLINRMNNKKHDCVPLKTIIKSAKRVFPRISINGKYPIPMNYDITLIVKLYFNNNKFFLGSRNLLSWLLNTMDFNPGKFMLAAETFLYDR